LSILPSYKDRKKSFGANQSQASKNMPEFDYMNFWAKRMRRMFVAMATSDDEI